MVLRTHHAPDGCEWRTRVLYILYGGGGASLIPLADIRARKP